MAPCDIHSIPGNKKAASFRLAASKNAGLFEFFLSGSLRFQIRKRANDVSGDVLDLSARQEYHSVDSANLITLKPQTNRRLKYLFCRLPVALLSYSLVFSLTLFEIHKL
jgi:hypothetical protein